MANYITSDLHLGHRAIINYCPPTRRHFTDVDQMNETIVSNINSVVTEEDTLYILGDIAFMPPARACEFLKRINGSKVIVWGNHDHKLRRSTEFASQKSLMGVVWEGDYKEQTFVVDDVRQQIMMMHFPIFSFNGQRHGAIHCHGHRHSYHEYRNTFGPNVRCIDIGLEGNSLMPYCIEDLVREMRKRPILDEDYHAKSGD